MATIYKTNGTTEEVFPKNGKNFTLDELTNIVGGFIEILFFDNGDLMVLNEEGKLLDMNYNMTATKLAHTHTTISKCDYIAGDVLVCKGSQIE